MKNCIAAVVYLMSNTEHTEIQHLAKIITLSEQLLDQYHKLKAAILDSCGYVSSLTELGNGAENLNIMMAKDYINETLLICNDCIESFANQFNERLKTIGQLKESLRDQIRNQIGEELGSSLFQIHFFFNC